MNTFIGAAFTFVRTQSLVIKKKIAQRLIDRLYRGRSQTSFYAYRDSRF